MDINDNLKSDNSAIFQKGKPNDEIKDNSFQKIFDESVKIESNSLEETKIDIKNNGNNIDNNTNNEEYLNNISKIVPNSENEDKEDEEDEEEEEEEEDDEDEEDEDTNIKHNKFKINKNEENLISELISYLEFFFETFIYCPKCKLDLVISLTCNFKYINIECTCSLIRNISLDKFKKKYYEEGKDCPLNKCKRHKKRYIAFCSDCRINLCKKCKEEIIDNVKIHGTHTKIKQNCKITKGEKFKLKKIIKENKDLEIFKFLEDYYLSSKKYPSYPKYKTIKNILSFLEKYPQFPEGFFSKDIKLKEEELKKINTLDKLNEQIDSKSIYSIDIDNKSSDIFWNLDFFKDKEFPKLEILNLNGLKINSLEPLCHKVFPNLKLFHLDRNEITNESIDVFNKLIMPKIESISLYENKITSIKIFSVMKNFKTLIKLYLGYNKFSADEIDEYIKNNKYGQKIELPPNLILLGLSGNFTKKTNKFIININLEKVQILYIYNNELNSLKIFKDIYFTNLKQIWLNNTIISNIEELTNLRRNKNIEVINLSGNYFRKSKNKRFIKSIESFPKLQKLILTRCGIPTKKILQIIKRINRKRVNENNKLEIIYEQN